MNYTTNSCRNEFVPEQVMWIRSTLINLRTSLTNTVGCELGCCSNLMAEFDVEDGIFEYPVNTEVNFINTSNGGDDFKWYINYEEVSSSFNLSHTFNEGGHYSICLDAVGDDGCIDRFCIEVAILPACLPINQCGALLNGNFEQIDGTSYSGLIQDNRVCNWVTIASSPYYCHLNDNGSLALYMTGNPIDIERVTTLDQIYLQEGETYNICFDYWVTCCKNNSDCLPPRLLFALTDNNDYNESPNLNLNDFIIVDFTPMSIDYYNQENHECPEFDPIYHKYSGSFIAPSDNLRYLTITGADATPVSITFIDNIKIHPDNENCCSGPCVPIPDFTYDENCPNQFKGVNTGDVGQFTWNFLCNNIIMSGQNVTIDLPPGECEICLTISCDLETATTICKNVFIPEPSDDCQPACENLTIPLQTCEQDISQENNFVANIELIVPHGTGPCGDGGILSGSSQADINLASISTVNDPTDPTMDIITLGIDVTTPQGTDLLNGSIAGNINLCDPEGNVICYNISFRGSECTNCLGEITATATCIDSLSTDSTFVYGGSVTITLPPLGFGESYAECDPVSAEVGYEQSVTISGNQANVNFLINTTTEGDFDASSLLCFEKGGVQYCYTLNISLSCPQLPTHCVSVWAAKPVACTRGGDGQLTYNFTMNSGIQTLSYQLCDFGLQASVLDANDDPIDGVNITINSFGQTSFTFQFDVDISVPCGLEGTTIYLRLYFCDDEGNIVCYLFPLILSDCSDDCGELGDGGSDGRSRADNYQNNVFVYPNPTTNSLNISVKNDESKQHIVHIIDHLGREIISEKFETHLKVRTDITTNGIYFVKVFNDRGEAIHFEKIIVIK